MRKYTNKEVKKAIKEAEVATKIQRETRPEHPFDVMELIVSSYMWKILTNSQKKMVRDVLNS